MVPDETGELVDIATAQSRICALYASGLAVCVDVQSRLRTVVFAANPGLQIRGSLKLRVADNLLCVASVWSVMCRAIDGAATPAGRVAEVRGPRGDWLLDSVRREICTTSTCVSIGSRELATPAAPMFPTTVLAEAGPLRRSAVTTENRWALDQCANSNGHGCLFCEGSGVCAKWRKSWDIAHTPPKMPRRATCINGPNQVERCPPTPPVRPIVMSEKTKHALIEKAWPVTTAPVSFGLVAQLPELGRRHRLVGNSSAMCVLGDDNALCATTTSLPRPVAGLPDWRNAEPVFMWATRLCALSRRDFRITCVDIDKPSLGIIAVNLPSTTQLEKYAGVIAASVQRLCYSDPRGGVTCLTTDANAPVELDAKTLLGLDANINAPTRSASRTSRTVGARYASDRYVTPFGPYLCRGETCVHAVTGDRAARRELPARTPLVLSPRATQEFAGYERRPTDTGVMACVPPVPKRDVATSLERLTDVSLPTVPMGRGGNWRCTRGNDAGFDVDVPTQWSRVIWWGSAACNATGSTVSCLPIQDGGRKMYTLDFGFAISAVDVSSELLCASGEAEAMPPVCWRLDPTVRTFTPQAVAVPASLQDAPSARIK